MELAKKRRKTIVVVLSIVIGFIVYQISMCVFAEYILNQGVERLAWFCSPHCYGFSFYPYSIRRNSFIEISKEKRERNMSF